MVRTPGSEARVLGDRGPVSGALCVGARGTLASGPDATWPDRHPGKVRPRLCHLGDTGNVWGQREPIRGTGDPKILCDINATSSWGTVAA